MKSFRGKIVMAAIILSCGFVMQAEQASENQRLQLHHAGPRSHDLAYNASNSAAGAKIPGLPGDRSSW